MPDLSQLSDEELRQIVDQPDLSQYSNEELERIAGIVPTHPLASLPLWKVLVSRPAAQYRGFVRGLAPGGETPIEGFTQGATAQGEDLVNRARPFDLQTPMLNAYYRRVYGNRAPTPLEQGIAMVGGMVPSTVGLMAQTPLNIATNPVEAITALLPFTRAGTSVAESVPGRAVGEFLTKERRNPIQVGRSVVEFLKGNPEAIQSSKANMEAALQQSAKQLDSDAYDVVTSYRRGGANHQDFFTRHGQLSDEAFAPVKQVGKAVIQPTPVDELKASIAAHYSDDPTFAQKAGLILDQMYEDAPQSGLTGESLISKSTELGENIRASVNKGVMPRNAGEQLITSIRAAIGQAIEARAPEELKGMYQTGMNQWAEHAADTRRLFRLLKPGAAQAEPTAEGVNFIKKAVTGGFDTDTDTQNFMSRVQSRYGINLPSAVTNSGEQVQQAQAALQKAQQVGARGSNTTKFGLAALGGAGGLDLLLRFLRGRVEPNQ